MNSSAAAGIEQFQLIVYDILVECVPEQPYYPYDEKLQWPNFADHSSESDEHRSHRVGGCGEIFLIDNNVEVVTITVEYCVPEGLKEHIQLDDESIEEKSIRKRTPGIILDESHQEPKSNQHHDIYILVHRVVVLIQIAITMSFHPHENSEEDGHTHLYYGKDDCEFPALQFLRLLRHPINFICLINNNSIILIILIKLRQFFPICYAH